MIHKKISVLLGTMALTTMVYAQPTGTPGNSSDWRRGGNLAAPPGLGGTSNIFGTVWNSPVYHFTANQFRMIVNGDKTTPTTVAAGSQNTSGFIGINVQNPLSRLHLGGSILSLYGGYRPWMREGFTIQNADDQMWFGLKRWGASPDQQNAVINWGDDAAGAAGPDHLVFNFSGSSFSNPYQIPGVNPSAATLDGLEVMRITDVGRVGIGPRFNNTFAPQSTLHQHQENAVSSWMQITNQGTGNVANATAPTAITANDGLRWGILGNQNLNNNGNAFIYNQENRHLIFSTNNAVPTDMSATNERMRITHIGAPGTPNPGALAQNSTRVSISHNPAAPITNPLSLLHLGYNSGLTNNDGWRSWMDVGMYIAQSSDNVFLGLKNESTNPLGDKFDAVLSWGDNQINSNLPPNNGPDNFRFIFTSTTAGSSGGTNPANTLNGLEGMRLTPTPANGVFTGVGGAPTVNPYSTGINPGNTMEINSWGATNVVGGSSGLRFTNLNSTTPTLANPGTGVLSVNAQGDVIYVPGGGSGNANNGLTVNSGNVQLGGDCGNDSLAKLTNNRSIPMNGHNINFRGDSAFTDKINIGFPCNLDKPGKVNIFTSNKTSSSINNQTRALNVDNYNSPNQANIGISVNSVTSPSILGIQYGILSYAEGGREAVGVRGISGGGRLSVGGDFQCNTLGTSSQFATGVRSGVSNGTINNFGVHAIAGGGQLAIGGYFRADNANAGSVAYGIYAEATTNGSTPGVAPTHYAGYFNGDVIVTGNASVGSDQLLKENIDSISNALSIINQLKPKTYTYKHSSFPSMQLAQGLQYGLIAQEVEQILPELVTNNTQPQVLDSLGNVVTPAVNFKGLEYQQLIPILIKALQEQQKNIDSLSTKQTKQDSINNAIQTQLAALASQINGCCTNGSAKVNQTTSQTQKTIHQMEIELSDKDAIVLEQNVPNPFAEQTTILYNLPASVGKAQLMFYNVGGQLIKAVDLNTRGNGKLIVFANDLSSGLYHYTLVADGKVVDSKKMVRE